MSETPLWSQKKTYPPPKSPKIALWAQKKALGCKVLDTWSVHVRLKTVLLTVGLEALLKSYSLFQPYSPVLLTYGRSRKFVPKKTRKIKKLFKTRFFAKKSVKTSQNSPFLAYSRSLCYLSAMRINAVIFDLGETLFNYGRANVNACFRRGARLAYEYLESLAGPEQKMCSFDHYFTVHFLYIRFLYIWSMVVGREFDCLALLNRRIQPMGFNLTPDQLEELACLWYDVLGQQAQLEDNLHRTLEELQKMGVQTAILSNTFLPGIALDRHLSRFGLMEFFPVRVYSSDTIIRKPNRRIYLECLKQLNVEPAQAIMVGDRLREDVRGPGRVGIRGIFKRGIVNARKHVPADVPVIDRIAQLPEWIKNNYDN